MKKTSLILLILGGAEFLSGLILTFFFSIVIYYFFASGANTLFVYQSGLLILFCLSLVFIGIILIKRSRVALLAHLISLLFYFLSLLFLYLWANEWKTSVFAVFHKFLWPFWWMAFPAFVLVFFNLKWVKQELSAGKKNGLL